MSFSANNNNIPSAHVENGMLVLVMSTGMELRFPVSSNPRLAKGSERELNNIEISPFGLHWPDLDEDLSFAGLASGDYGQMPCGGTAHSLKDRPRSEVA
jgi:hypothetical protein